MYIRGLNCRGLRDDETRKNMFHWLKQKVRGRSPGINILSETHCHDRKDMTNWGREWSLNEDNSYWSMGTKHSKGVAILINDSFREAYPDMKILNVCTDPNGRYVKLILQISNCNFRILGVYAPNNGLERVKFFRSLRDLVNDSFDAENIYGGDYNCAFDSDLDRYNCSGSNDLGKKDLSILCNILDIEDVWRRRNPNKIEYSWTGRGKKSRIDYWLSSISLNSQIKSVFYSFAPYTDHSAINMIVNIDEIKRGPGIWKMNSSILVDQNYIEGITSLWTKWQNKKDSYADKKRWWDLGKRHIKSYSISYSKEKSMVNKCNLTEIEEKIDLMKKANADYERLQKQYEDLFSIKSKGARVRSRIKDWEEGEKSTKYFYSLEKRNAKEKSWSEILDPHGNLITGHENIQKRQLEFYQDLFRSQKNDENATTTDFFFDNINQDCQLSEANKNMMDEDLSNDEILKALKKMPNNKSPGPDGIITEFYKMFWNLIGEDLCEILRIGLEDEELSYSQYLAVITLLYKKGNRADIKNWRPISLLNSDYKLLSKVLAERLRKVLPEIIHSDQRGCISGRYIGENIRLIDDLLFEIEQGRLPFSILQLDQEKAFDRVEWSWLFKTLESFNFGSKFINYLKTMYKNAKSSILTNGYQSTYFSITRGIRQGDSLSALLFIIQFEPLMRKIRNDPSIEGVQVELKNLNSTIESKGCQYVDDSNSFLKNDSSIVNFFNLLQKYESDSGSKVNVEKTVCLVPDKNTRDRISNSLSNMKLKIKAGPEKVLGVLLGKCPDNFKGFWDEKIDKMESKLKVWKCRSLSYDGKVLLIRSIAISQVMFAIEMKPIGDAHIKRIKDLIFDFLWSGKNIRIKKEICYLPRSMGGLNVANIEALIKVKRVQWVIRFLKENSGQTWSKIFENYIRCLDNKYKIQFFSLKVTDSTDLLKKTGIPLFYQECITSFQEFLRLGKSGDGNEILWCNHKFKFNKKPLNFHHWSSSGIKTVNDLYNGTRIVPHLLKSKLQIKYAFFFEMWRLKRIFPMQRDSAPVDTGIVTGGKEFILQTMINIPNTASKTIHELSSKDIYNVFNLSNPPLIPSLQYWSEKFDDEIINWDTWFEVNTINRYSPRPCKSFNFRILHGQVNTESKLKYMKHSNGYPYSNGKCIMCSSGQEENLEHVLYYCPNSRRIWRSIQTLLSKFKGTNIRINRINATTGFWRTEVNDELLIVNTICSITRFHLWKIRCKVKFGNEMFDYLKSTRLLKSSLHNHIKTLLSSTSSNNQILQMMRNLDKLIQEIIFL